MCRTAMFIFVSTTPHVDEHARPNDTGALSLDRMTQFLAGGGGTGCGES